MHPSNECECVKRAFYWRVKDMINGSTRFSREVMC